MIAQKGQRLKSNPKGKPKGSYAKMLDIIAANKPKGMKTTEFGYHAATIARRSPDPLPRGGSGDRHLFFDLEILRRESQRYDRDNPIYNGLIGRALDNILGNGFTLQARTKSKRVNDKLENLWAEFSLDPEVRGMSQWWEVERLVTRSLWIDGDIGAIKTTSGKLQLIEAERITTNIAVQSDEKGKLKVTNGVEVDSVGRPVAYHIADFTPLGDLQKVAIKKVPAKDFIFLANLLRTSQTRGVPVLVSNFPMFERLDDVLNSEAIAWQMQARLALISNFESSPDVMQGLTQSDPDEVHEAPPELTDRITEMEAGTWFQGLPGETIEAVKREIPAQNFPDAVTMYIRLLGLPVGMPLELVLLDWSKTNYSSARAALEQAFRMFHCWQQKLRQHFHTPVYSWKVQQWIAAGLIDDRPDIFKHEWIAPEFPWLDQLKEAMAWGERIDRGLATLTMANASLNMDHNEYLIQRRREVEEAVRIANEITEATGTEIPWTIFAGIKDGKKAKAPDAPKASSDFDDDPAPPGDQPGSKKPPPDDEPEDDDEGDQ